MERRLALLRARHDRCSGPRADEPYAPRPAQPFHTEAFEIVSPGGFDVHGTLRLPVDAGAPLPVVVFSVPADWGAFRRAPDASFLADRLAGCGYAVVTVRHPGNDALVLPIDPDTAPDKIAYVNRRFRDPASFVGRTGDLSFVLDTLEQWNGAGPHQGRFDLARIGMSGHSFGGLAALLMAGQRLPPDFTSHRDGRVRAVATYSAIALDAGLPQRVYDDMAVPGLQMTGTADFSYGTPHRPVHRLLPFRRASCPCQYGVMLTGADHHTFGGGRIDKGNASRREHLCHQWIQSIALAFWDAHLRGDPAAHHWLTHDLAGLLGDDGRCWHK